MTIPYRFLPWTRRGLARSHANADGPGVALSTRPKVTIGLTLHAKQDGNEVTAVSGNIDLTLYGPADIIGIDPRLVVRTDPKPNVTNFEPNYLAIVDFDPPDFPWLLTPARANADHRLRPWLVLIVLDRSQVKSPALKPGRPLPSIELTAQQVQTDLPDLDESHLFAHTQAVSERSKADPAGLASELDQYPERNISRLVCPRRLEARKNYVACVVPATDGGCARGLGKPVQSPSLGKAWNAADNIDIELPVYYHWEFSTGPVGDIETLARRLRRPEEYATDTTLIAQLQHIGEQPVIVDGDHLLFEGSTPGRTIFEGAMVSLDFKAAPIDKTFSDKLEAMLDTGQLLAATGAPKADVVPTLSPPIYGEFPAKRHIVDGAQAGKHWLDGLSLQPRYRLAAGWGAEIVRRNQDEFMQAAWEQVGDVLAAERAFSLSRLSRDVLLRVARRHLDKLPEARLMAVLSPARARIRVGPGQSLYGSMGVTTLPDELFDGAMRRLASPRRSTFVKAQWRDRARAQVSVTAQMVALVDTFANATRNLNAVDPNRFVPDGLMGSVSYDRIPLPADLNAVIDLKPYTGLSATMTASEIRTIQQQNTAARAEAARTQRSLPSIGDVWQQGLITETHVLRLAELEQAAGRPLTGDFSALIQKASVSGAEGVLLSVDQAGTVSGQSLKIDARNGKLTSFGPMLVATITGVRAARGARAGPAGVATVSTSALKLYGKTSVVTTLPPSVLGQGAEPVQIDLAGPGRFTSTGTTIAGTVGAGTIGGVGAGTVGGGVVIRPERIAPTITLPPAIKDRAVLQRYADAFKEYQQLWVPPSPAAEIRAVDFALKPAVQQTRTRVDPAQSVPARLASMLTLANASIAWTASGFANPFISARLDVALAERLRYLIPLTFDRVMAYPHLLFPLSKKLEAFAPEVFLPGVGALPTDFIMAVRTNPRLVEALMLGANHEMGRELLWQGFPTDQRGTPFQRFWQRLDDKDDIAPIHQWSAVPLGSQPGSSPMLVLLIRGQLLERFPTLAIYAYPIDAKETRPGGSSPPVAPGNPDPKEMDPNRMVLPVIRGHLLKDITYIGFDIDPDKMEKFFFILQEQMTEPRFGFDEPDAEGQDGPTWLDVDWGEVGVDAGACFGSKELKQAPPARNKPQWVTPHAATVADALLQRPFRGYYAGARLKTPKPG